MVLEHIWQEFLSIVRQEEGSRVVETWLKAVTLTQWDTLTKTVYVQAPNRFVKDWIFSNYRELFTLHLGRLLNVTDLTVMFLQEGDATAASDKMAAPPTNIPPTAQTFMSETRVTEPPAPKPSTPVINMPHTRSTAAAIKPAVRAVDMETSPELLPALERQPARSAHAGSREARVTVIKRPVNGRARVSSSYKLNTFVVGPNNNLAYAAAHAVTERPGQVYNPLFIYGPSGLGKTHLLHAIANEIRDKFPEAIILYQTADRFVNEFITAIRFDKVHQFKDKYHRLDVLLIDDIQFLSNKDQTQEAFFHIFNILYEAKKQIVFTSDLYPKDIKGLAQRLRSRLEGGMLTDISAPTLETKVAIIKKKAEVNGEVLSDDVSHYIASQVNSNIRELEGALIRVIAFASLTGNDITIDVAKKVLKRSEYREQSVRASERNLDDIAGVVSKHFSISLNEMRSQSRNRSISHARQVAMYLMKHMTNKSLMDIAHYFTRKDHSTVLYAVQKIKKHEAGEAAFKDELHAIRHEITL